MKINFKNVEYVADFEGHTEIRDTAKYVANAMMFTGSRLLDIGFEDLAREIYYSEGDVEVPEQYAPYIWEVVNGSMMMACIKRRIKELLNIK